MIHYNNLIVIGSSHIASQSLQEIEQVITQELPSVVALELDSQRLQALLQGEKKKLRVRDVRRIGVKGYLFARFGEFVERKLGESVGVKPGDDMLKGVEMAQKVGAQLALIDQPIHITLKRLSKAITYREKWQFVKDMVLQAFRPKKIPFDLRTVPKEEVLQQLIVDFQRKYPRVYKVLVEERNAIMAKALKELMQTQEKIVAIVGAGHEKELITLLSE